MKSPQLILGKPRLRGAECRIEVQTILLLQFNDTGTVHGLLVRAGRGGRLLDVGENVATVLGEGAVAQRLCQLRREGRLRREENRRYRPELGNGFPGHYGRCSRRDKPIRRIAVSGTVDTNVARAGPIRPKRQLLDLSSASGPAAPEVTRAHCDADDG